MAGGSRQDDPERSRHGSPSATDGSTRAEKHGPTPASSLRPGRKGPSLKSPSLDRGRAARAGLTHSLAVTSVKRQAGRLRSGEFWTAGVPPALGWRPACRRHQKMRQAGRLRSGEFWTAGVPPILGEYKRDGGGTIPAKSALR